MMKIMSVGEFKANFSAVLKSALGKTEITGLTPEELPDACLQLGFDIVPLSSEENSTYHKLKMTYHKDPFDRMLIRQAIIHGFTLKFAGNLFRNIRGSNGILH